MNKYFGSEPGTFFAEIFGKPLEIRRCSDPGVWERTQAQACTPTEKTRGQHWVDPTPGQIGIDYERDYDNDNDNDNDNGNGKKGLIVRLNRCR